MFIVAFFKGIGHVFASIFRGKVKKFANQWGDLIVQMVYMLTDVTVEGGGSTKLQKVLTAIKSLAAQQGKEYIEASAVWVAEMELAKINNDNVKQILEDGLGSAVEAVKKFIDAGMSDQAEVRKLAAGKLVFDLKATGQEMKDNTLRNINLLVATAMAQVLGEK
jgi:hypothetical protein